MRQREGPGVERHTLLLATVPVATEERAFRRSLVWLACLLRNRATERAFLREALTRKEAR